MPVSAAHVIKGANISILTVNKKDIPLSSSIFDPTVYPEVEKTLGINISDYALAK